MRWRLLPFEAAPASMNMAIDEAVSEGVRDGTSPPTMRFYAWRPGAVSLGCFQSVEEEVDPEACLRLGVDIVRRRTGGGAVYHDPEGEITYSVIAPEGAMGRDINASYREVCGWVVDALGELGVHSEFRPINDIVASGRKVSGCAQTRREGAFLQHGTVLYSIDPQRMFKLLKVSKTKISDKDIAGLEDRVTALDRLTDATKADLLAALHRSFLRCKEWYEAPLSERERDRAAQLAKDRYANPQWTWSR